MNMEDLIANEPVIITISEDDYIKRMPVDTFREQRRGGQGVTGMQMKREDDAIKGLYVASTHDYLLIFTTLGALLLAQSVADSRNGPQIQRQTVGQSARRSRPRREDRNDLERRIVRSGGVFDIDMTRNGIVKKNRLQELATRASKGIWALAIDEGELVVATRSSSPVSR